MDTLALPAGRPLRFTGAVILARAMVLTRLPLTLTTAEMNVTPGSLRIRIVNARRLTHFFADGSVKAFVAEIGGGADGLVTGVAAGRVAAGRVTAGGVL